MISIKELFTAYERTLIKIMKLDIIVIEVVKSLSDILF